MPGTSSLLHRSQIDLRLDISKSTSWFDQQCHPKIGFPIQSFEAPTLFMSTVVLSQNAKSAYSTIVAPYQPTKLSLIANFG